MGGKIWVESEVGSGSTFHFTAQLAVSDGQTSPVELADPGSLRGVHVLVVDDNKTNTTILAEILASWGMSADCVESAGAALAALALSQTPNRRFALIITDVRMPDMDGFQLFEEVRRKPDFASLPFLLLGSGGQLGERQRCEEMGISGYLTKPVQPSELFNAILGALPHLTESRLSGTAAPDSPQERKEGMKVLVAEDNAVNRTLARRLLEKHGHTVITAENGREALEWVGREAFDLVLMDVQMPEMGGLEATATIRKKEAVDGGHLPIIALTAHAMKGDREVCLQAGSDDYLTKPIRTEEFFAALDRIKSGLPIQRSPSSLPEKPFSSDAIDMAAALERVDSDRSLLLEIARLFEDECPKAMAGIRAALENGDASALERLAHTLKGSSSNLGALAVSRAAADLERHARAGDLGAARDNFKILAEQVARLHIALAALLSEVTS
jgi:CheY-like chemotaxis protein/HPt (histidine-containing phosphotransfer) domain-containing protein